MLQLHFCNPITLSERILVEAHNLRVVVIDDNIDAADTFGWLLEAEGIKAEVRYSASAGLEVSATFKAHVVFAT